MEKFGKHTMDEAEAYATKAFPQYRIERPDPFLVFVSERPGGSVAIITPTIVKMLGPVEAVNHAMKSHYKAKPQGETNAY